MKEIKTLDTNEFNAKESIIFLRKQILKDIKKSNYYIRSYKLMLIVIHVFLFVLLLNTFYSLIVIESLSFTILNTFCVYKNYILIQEISENILLEEEFISELILFSETLHNEKFLAKFKDNTLMNEEED